MADTQGNPGAEAQPGADASKGDTNPQQVPGDRQQPVADGSGRGAEKTYSFKEDRSDWIPRQRLNESSAKYEKRIADYEARVAAIEQQQDGVKKAFGINTPSKKEQEVAEMREAIYEVLPHLRGLEKLTPEQLEQILATAEAAGETTRSHWERQADTMIGDVESEIVEELGVEKSTPYSIR